MILIFAFQILIVDSYGFFDKALKSLRKSLTLTRKVLEGHDLTTAMTLRKLGNIHFKRKNYEMALSCLEESVISFSHEIGVGNGF